MRIVFAILVVLHAFIHLLGFAKGFGLADIRQLSEPISKSAGGLWLLAFVLLITAAALFVFRSSYWWAIALAAVVVSQLLIFYSWHDAKFGTSMNLLILLVAIVGYAASSYYGKFKNDVNAGLLSQAQPVAESLLTESDLHKLPEAVKRYLRYSGCVGRPKVKNFRIEFTGAIRKDEQSPWMPFTSEQYNFMEMPTRLFFMKAVMKGLPVAGYHCFKNGHAFMDIRLLSLFRVQYQDGAEMDTAETVTFFNDMCCMAPATLIDERIVWQETGENSVSAIFTDSGISISAELCFNQAGELVNFISNDRYAADAGKKLPWSTPLKNYMERDGYRLASEAETIYAYEDHDLCYGKFQMVSVQYNCMNWK